MCYLSACCPDRRLREWLAPRGGGDRQEAPEGPRIPTRRLQVSAAGDARARPTGARPARLRPLRGDGGDVARRARAPAQLPERARNAGRPTVVCV